ncbi:MAG: hypothetical protein WAW39_28980 [Prosthecobacter sp.]|uniref:hypothetical protein n=1 Tax=Prosthecobacter sp. TaxID=1965333 RepID=UPI003BB02059
MQTHPLLLTLPDTIPSWIAGKPAKAILEVVNTACQYAGITGPAQFRFLLETKGLVHRMPPHSLVIRHAAPYNRPNLIALTACGKDGSNHRVHCTLTLPEDQRPTFERFIQSQDQGCFVLNTFRNPVLPPGLPLPAPSVAKSVEPTVVPPAPEFDDDALAIYLSSLQELGAHITQDTASIIAIRSTGALNIYRHALDAGLIYRIGSTVSLTPGGHSLLKRLAPADDATKPGPSEFDRLKADLIAARSRFTEAKATHDARAQALTTLTHQLTQAREAYQSEELNATTLQSRLQKLQQDLNSAQCKVTGARRHVLDLEEQARALGTDTPDLIQAERTLKEAETAYQQLIAL